MQQPFEAIDSNLVDQLKQGATIDYKVNLLIVQQCLRDLPSGHRETTFSPTQDDVFEHKLLCLVMNFHCL
jgi:hypothetical protein